MKSTVESEKERENRTIVLQLGNTLKKYNELISTEVGMNQLVRRVEIADKLNWGHLVDGHKPGCCRGHRFTYHGSYERGLKHYTGGQSRVTIVRARCLDCGAAFTVLPAFVVRYKRQDADAIEKMMVQLFITEDSYRMAGVSKPWRWTQPRWELGLRWKPPKSGRLHRRLCGDWCNG